MSARGRSRLLALFVGVTEPVSGDPESHLVIAPWPASAEGLCETAVARCRPTTSLDEALGSVSCSECRRRLAVLWSRAGSTSW